MYVLSYVSWRCSKKLFSLPHVILYCLPYTDLVLALACNFDHFILKKDTFSITIMFQGLLLTLHNHFLKIISIAKDVNCKHHLCQVFPRTSLYGTIYITQRCSFFINMNTEPKAKCAISPSFSKCFSNDIYLCLRKQPDSTDESCQITEYKISDIASAR